MNKTYIKQALEELGTSQSSLYRIMGKLGIKPKKEGKKSYLTDSQFKKLKEHLNSPTHDKKNEKDIWAYMIKNKLIYSKDENLNKRFISVAPFSKFYSKLDRQSPGRVGVWLGWQIVKSYMDNNDVSLPELMSNDNALEILSKSKYKPSK